MYSNFKNIQISPRKLFIVDWDDNTFEYDFIRDIDVFHDGINPTVDGKHIMQVHGERILICEVKKHEPLFEIFNPQQFRWQVNKDIKKEGGLFDLNYRKHLRSEYSQKWIKICLMGWDVECNTEWKRQLRFLYKLVQKFSTGKENRPLLIVNVMEDQLEYTILKNDIMVRRGSIDSEMEWC